MKEDTIVLYPAPGIGHLISMVELGKLILNHHPSLSITIFITNPPFNTGSTDAYIKRVSITNPLIIFHHLPIISLSIDSISSLHHEALAMEVLRLNNPNVHESLQKISQSSNIKALVIDLFCTPAFEVAKTLKIPLYYFVTCGASVMAAFLHLPTITKSITKSFKDLEMNLNFPGLPPIPASDLPKPLLDRSDMAYEILMNYTEQQIKSSGLIVNSFKSLEGRAIKAVSDGICIPDGPTPSIYYIGPLITSNGEENGVRHECLTWLDSQPGRSVVFLCFGSLGLFSESQLKEIGNGLEKSGQRFLWVVRKPPSTEDESKRFLAPPEPDLEALLPDGFMERVKGRGLVVKSWAPQVEVLSHDSVGGFVTHCGWNSVLEAICAGVPMVAWPLYAEQRMNRVIMVEEMKLALSIVEREDGFVTGDVVEKVVRDLMESEEGRELRERIMAMRKEAKAAMNDGGSSLVELDRLVMSWKKG